jgi:hypothetical protein
LKAIGLPGGHSWELVTVKVGSTSSRHDSFLLDNQVTYFKRPVIPGRSINDVELNFTVNIFNLLAAPHALQKETVT